jgi:hypothetical protein
MIQPLLGKRLCVNVEVEVIVFSGVSMAMKMCPVPEMCFTGVLNNFGRTLTIDGSV